MFRHFAFFFLLQLEHSLPLSLQFFFRLPFLGHFSTVLFMIVYIFSNHLAREPTTHTRKSNSNSNVRAWMKNLIVNMKFLRKITFPFAAILMPFNISHLSFSFLSTCTYSNFRQKRRILNYFICCYFVTVPTLFIKYTKT